MKDMSSMDASLLALMADAVYGEAEPDSAVRRRLVDLAKRITDPQLRKVAAALISGEESDDAAVGEILGLLRTWAERNRRVHSPAPQKTAR